MVSRAGFGIKWITSCFVSSGGLWWPTNVYAERLLVPGGCVNIFRHLCEEKTTGCVHLSNGELLSAIFEGGTGHVLVSIFHRQHHQQHHQQHQPNYHNHPDNHQVKWGNSQSLPRLPVSSLSCPHLVSPTIFIGMSTAFILTWCGTYKWMYAPLESDTIKLKLGSCLFLLTITSWAVGPDVEDSSWKGFSPLWDLCGGLVTGIVC